MTDDAPAPAPGIDDGDADPRRQLQHRPVVAFLLRVVPYLFVAAMLAYLASRRHDLAKLGDAAPSDLALLAALVVLGQVMNALEYWIMYRAAGIPIGLRENQALFNAGQLGNYLPMQVGTMYRFRYLKVVHRLRYANTASFLLMNLALTLGSTALCGLLGLARAHGQRPGRPVVGPRRRVRRAAGRVPGVGAPAAAEGQGALEPPHDGVGGVPRRVGERAPAARPPRSRCSSSTR